MTDNSLLKGSIWYWRQGVRQTPIHSYKDKGGFYRTKELYIPVKNENLAHSIINEFQRNGINVGLKRTRSSYDVVPAGSLIIFAAESLETITASEKENIEKMKSYIIANGGRIGKNPQKVSAIKGFLQNFFGGK